MTSRGITIAGYLAVVCALALLEALSARPGSGVPSFRALVGGAMRSGSGRVGLLAFWLWLGLHFFGR